MARSRIFEHENRVTFPVRQPNSNAGVRRSDGLDEDRHGNAQDHTHGPGFGRARDLIEDQPVRQFLGRRLMPHENPENLVRMGWDRHDAGTDDHIVGRYKDIVGLLRPGEGPDLDHRFLSAIVSDRQARRLLRGGKIERDRAHRQGLCLKRGDAHCQDDPVSARHRPTAKPLDANNISPGHQ